MRLILFALFGLLALPASAKCGLSDISIKSFNAGFVNPCRTSPCYSMKGVGVLTNRCSQPVGVQLKMVAYDKSGNPVAVNDSWPASVNNIPPGDYIFSLDTWIDYNPAIKTFTLQPISVRQWR